MRLVCKELSIVLSCTQLTVTISVGFQLQGNDGEKIVSNLRSGAAVENAFAKMQERGFSNLRRSRHRLTPGTVKFAAFHVLSLEGEKGLTILEVADRIQVTLGFHYDLTSLIYFFK